MKMTGHAFTHRLRVRYVDVDMQKIVYFGNYLAYFDEALSHLWMESGQNFEDITAETGGDFHVVKCEIDYLASAEIFDDLDVSISVSRIGNSSIAFDLRIDRVKDGLHTTNGKIVWVFADQTTHKSMPLTAGTRAFLAQYQVEGA